MEMFEKIKEKDSASKSFQLIKEEAVKYVNLYKSELNLRQKIQEELNMVRQEHRIEIKKLKDQDEKLAKEHQTNLDLKVK